MEKEQKELFNVRNKRSKNWFWLDNEYLNGFGRILGAPGIAVYVSLCRHVNDNDGKCFPSQKTIAEETKLSERKVRDVIRDLEKHKIIKITKERTSKGNWSNNTYWLLDKSNWIYPEAHGACGQQPEANTDTPRGRKRHIQRQVVPPNKTNKNKTNKNKTNKDDILRSISAKQSFATDLSINDLIELFKDINPSYERLFPNKTQRSALERLVKRYGVEEVTRIIKVLPITNKEQFAPVITTPAQLESKLGSLASFLQRREIERKQNKITRI